MYSCKEVYDSWWKGACDSKDGEVKVDAIFLKHIMRDIPGRLQDRLHAPVYCNQWGVKDEVGRQEGRLKYATALLDAFASEGIHSTMWIWRSYSKGGRDIHKPEWGFELVRNPGHDADGNLMPELIDPEMTNTLQTSLQRSIASPCRPASMTGINSSRTGTHQTLPSALRGRNISSPTWSSTTSFQPTG